MLAGVATNKLIIGGIAATVAEQVVVAIVEDASVARSVTVCIPGV